MAESDDFKNAIVYGISPTRMKDREAIVIAHRLATVKKSDRIVVMDQGGVVLGIGAHEDLIKRIPLYRNLVELELLV